MGRFNNKSIEHPRNNKNRYKRSKVTLPLSNKYRTEEIEQARKNGDEVVCLYNIELLIT